MGPRVLLPIFHDPCSSQNGGIRLQEFKSQPQGKRKFGCSFNLSSHFHTDFFPLYSLCFFFFFGYLNSTFNVYYILPSFHITYLYMAFINHLAVYIRTKIYVFFEIAILLLESSLAEIFTCVKIYA